MQTAKEYYIDGGCDPNADDWWTISMMKAYSDYCRKELLVEIKAMTEHLTQEERNEYFDMMINKK